MKINVTKLVIILIITLVHQYIIADAFAQAPQEFNYQAVITDNSGNVIANQAMNFRLSIHDGLPGGTLVYCETQTAATNQFGLVNFALGAGTPVSGDFTTINWGTGNKYVQLELDITGGTTFIDYGTSHLLSVPYALYANNAGVGGPTGPTGLTGATGATGPTGSSDQTFFLSTDQSAGNGQYIGSGTCSASFIRNTCVVPANGTLTALVFHIRDELPEAGHSAEIIVARAATPLVTISTGIIASPSATATFAAGSGSFSVFQGDLISVRVTNPSGSYSNGVATNIYMTVP